MPPIGSPIPGRVIAYVGGMNYRVRAYVLWKNGQMIVVQAPPLDLITNRWKELGVLTTFTESEYRELELEYWRGLEIIHTLIDSVDFGRTNWGYLIPWKGGYQILQKEKKFRRISMALWAPLVDEDDITYTTWWACEHRKGIWKGREVEVFMGWDGDGLQMQELERTMQGYQYVRGMDLTYEVLGHIMRDGHVIGLMTEPHVGRLVQYRDRALLYDAVSRMERRRLVHMAPTPPNLLIHDGKVRLSNVACIRYFREDQEEEFRETVEIRHWSKLEEVFSDMDSSFFFNIPNIMHERQSNVHILPDFPSIERPLRVTILAAQQARPFILDMYKMRKNLEKKLERHRNQGLSVRSRIPESLDEEAIDTALEVVEDRPYIAPIASSRRKKQRNEQYNAKNSTSKRLLLACED